MRIIFSLFIVTSLLYGCGSGSPDVSHIKVDLSLQRFEKDFFEGDTSKQFFYNIQQKYPDFGGLFLERIIGAEANWPVDTAMQYINKFRNTYRSIYDTTQLLFKSFEKPLADIKHTLQFAKYYFPDRPIPNKVITYLGPLDGYGDIIAENMVAVGLQHHLDSTCSYYQDETFQTVYPNYLSRNFSAAYIDINLAKNLINDYFPEKMDDKSLIQQMIEKGKRIYVLSLLTPQHQPQDWIGYTKKQYDDCLDHEKNIWNFFIQNNYLQITEFVKIRNFIGESPKTQELGEDAPGNIGSFVGWQIVKTYMKKNTKTSLTALMETEADAIFEDTKYKP